MFVLLLAAGCPRSRRRVCGRRSVPLGSSIALALLAVAWMPGGAVPVRAAVTTQGDVTLPPMLGRPSIGNAGYGSVVVDGGSTLAVPEQLLSMGTATTGVGILNVSGLGSQAQLSSVTVGGAGLGLITVTGGGRLSTGTVQIGQSPGGYGELVVDGPGSTFTASSNGIVIGVRDSSGRVVASGGAFVETGTVTIGGSKTAAEGRVIVTGTGTTWLNRGGLSLIATRDSELQILAGAKFLQTAQNGVQVDALTATGRASATVAGIGSLWNVAGTLGVGTLGRGTSALQVSGGGVVTGTLLNVGTTNANSETPGTTSVTVTGLGSLLTLGSGLTIAGPSTLSIRDGARVTTSSLRVNSGSTTLPGPVVTVEGAGSVLGVTSSNFSLGSGAAPTTLRIARGGVVELNSIFFSTSTGTRIELAGGAINVPATRGQLSNRGLIQGDGRLGLDVSNVSDGRIVVGVGQQLSISGRLFSQGMIELSRGALEFGSAATTSSLWGTTRLAIDGQGAAANPNPAPLTTPGRAALRGTLAVSFADAYAPVLGDSFPLLSTASGVSGRFAATELPALADGLAWLVNYQPTTVALDVVGLHGADFDGDGVVAAADLAIWHAHFGSGAGMSHAAGDASGDGAVAGDDFLRWQRAVTANSVPAIINVAVPEPAAWLLAIVALSTAARWSPTSRRR